MAATREEKIVSDDEDIPGLEDVTELLEKAQHLRSQLGGKTTDVSSSNAQNGHEAKKKVTSTEKQPMPTLSSTAKAEIKKAPQAKKSETFGGMRKGFLFGGKPAKPTSSKSSSNASSSKASSSNASSSKASSSEASSSKASTSSADALPLIKPKDPSSDASKLEIPEVQEAMKTGEGLMGGKEWVTEELLQKVQSRPHLLSKMSDPDFMRAIAEYQTDPKQAVAKYQDNTEITEFLRDFFGILGEHFKTVPVKGETSQKEQGPVLSAAPGHELKPEEQDHIDRILADPDMKQTLTDPGVLKLMGLLHQNPEEAHRMLAEADPALKDKVGKLMGAGLLQVQR